MKAGIALLLALATLWGAPVAAQSGPDARIARLEAGVGARLRLPTFDDTPQAILFARGERIQSVAVSDPAAYVFGLSGTGDSMTLKPAGPSTLATMRVDTDRAGDGHFSPEGVFSVFAVHGTSMPASYGLYHGDVHGLAARLGVRQIRRDYPASTRFVAATATGAGATV